MSNPAPSPSNPQQQSPPPTCRALVFVGPMNPPATKNLRTCICIAMNESVQNLHLLLTSSGGSLQEAFALYHLLKSIPLSVSTYNIDIIESAANIVFLAGRQRYCCKESRFMFHAVEGTISGSLAPERLVEQAALLDNYHARLTSLLNIFRGQ